MSDTLHFTLKSSIFDRSRLLTITPNYLEFDNRSSVGLDPTRFKKEEIKALRYGVKPIEGYQFVIGSVYCIDICNTADKIIKLRLKSLYGIGRNQLVQKYADIVNALLDYFFDNIAISFLEKFTNGESFTILDVFFCANGVQLNKRAAIIVWEDLGTKSYFHYYAMFSKANPNHYKAFEYLVDWNTCIIYTVSRQILKEKGLWSEE